MVERAFIVGVQRCGTTYLYHLLDNHPDIDMAKPVRPEPKVFLDESFDINPSTYDERLFPNAPSVAIRGEKSTSYIEHEAALARLSRVFPDARVLVVLRDPVERAISHLRYSLDNGLETRSVNDALAQAVEGNEPSYDPFLSVSPFSYVERGRYLDQLRVLEDHVSRAQVFVVILERLLIDQHLTHDIYDFLGVDRTYRASPGVKVNSSRARIDVPEALRQQLKDYYRPLNMELQAYLGQPLELWQ